MVNKTEKVMKTPKDVLPGEILYADLHFINSKREKFVVKEQIISREYTGEMQTIFTKDNDGPTLNKWKIKQTNVVLVNLNVIANLGYKNPPLNKHE